MLRRVAVRVADRRRLEFPEALIEAPLRRSSAALVVVFVQSVHRYGPIECSVSSAAGCPSLWYFFVARWCLSFT